MNTPAVDFAPGALVRARNREWVVQPRSRTDLLRLRPLGGSDLDQVTLIPELEPTPPEPALFPWPDPAHPGTHDAALLLRDALQLKLRNGAGPFRCFGNIAVEPRAYQLVPLLMALRLPTVRLLIADDVGIGKTVEAGLILRELMDRDEIARLAVLCPPHLAEQWHQELETHFHLSPVVLKPATARRLEQRLPHGVSLFDHYPVVVVSLDYIKSERHREHFLSIAPECVVVDEAHTCAAGRGRQLRFELLRRLAADETRHMLLLTATPHSGDDAAFHNLLSLLKPEFETLPELGTQARKPLRERLARHFVQRRRKDIDEWRDSALFPRRMTTEVTYTLGGPWGDFFDQVQEYCIGLAARFESSGHHAAPMIWYATLALMRCVASSPAAARKTLTTRLTASVEENDAPAEEERLFDGHGADLSVNDMEPPGRVEEEGRLQDLIDTATKLAGTGKDPKLAALVTHLEELLKEGFRPVVFCRYIATAHYVAEHLQDHLKSATVDAVTGAFTPEQREERVAALADSPHPVLVATDCLSEGINLQNHFTAVVHYDLAWNPTRHEQREGRVDRFGQKAPEVRCTMIYGRDNPVDGFILQVILKKAEAIRRELGVLVPLPEDDRRIHEALVKAALLKRNREKTPAAQYELFPDFEAEARVKALSTRWQDAMEKARANRTLFAQRRLKPEAVLPEWRRQLDVLGGEADVARFVGGACARLGAPLEPGPDGTVRLVPGGFPQSLRERMAREGITTATAMGFHYPAPPGMRFIHRSHPLVALLADTVLEGALSEPHPPAARSAATVTADVEILTTLYLLRLRHRIDYTKRGESRSLMAEETAALGVAGRAAPRWIPEADIPPLLNVTPSANLDPKPAGRQIREALDFLSAHQARVDDLARRRADALLADHRRVREAARDVGGYTVTPCLPVDLVGVYLLLPDSL